MAKLKVFSWSNGFHRFTVATSSMPRALEAWGVSQDLFKTGLAAEDPGSPDADAALANPGEVIQRGEAIDVGEVEARPKAKTKPRAAAKPKGPSAADLRRIEKLKADLDALESRHEADLAKLDAERQALDDRAAALRDAHRKARADLKKKLDAARARL